MKNIDFKIHKISAGWFVAGFIVEDDELYIQASDAWENDSPKYFLEMLSDILEKKEEHCYVGFDEEPGEYIVCISNTETAGINILFSPLANHDWTEIELHGNLPRREIERNVFVRDELFAVNDIDLKYFAESVLGEFAGYVKKHKRDKYEGNWMEFPIDEFKRLKGIVERGGGIAENPRD